MAATFEKANAYGFASSLIRNAEVVGSNPICSTTRITQSILYRMDSIKTFPKDVQNILQEIRRTIKKAAPTAEELITYRIPVFKLKGKRLVYFAAFKKHIGLYPPAPKAFKEVSAYAGPKGNLQFPLDRPTPVGPDQENCYPSGQYVARKNSTWRISDGKEWERM